MTSETLQPIAIVIAVMIAAVVALSAPLEFVVRRATHPRAARALAAVASLIGFGLIVYYLRPHYISTPVLNGIKVALLAVGATQIGFLVTRKAPRDAA